MEYRNNLTWLVKHYNSNANAIEDYDVLKYQTDNIKKLKKKFKTKEEFAAELRTHFMYHYWSKCEWELIVSRIDGKIFLIPWCGCRNPDEVTIEVTNDKSFDWIGFADKHITNQIYKYEAKIDVWDQIEYRWEEFVDYCWNTRLKYERKRKDEEDS